MTDDFEHSIDKIIREAEKKGAFRDLKGKGKPIQWEDDGLVPEDERLAHKILRDNGFTLDWIEMGKEIERQYEDLRAALESQRRARGEGLLSETAWQRARVEFSEKVRDLNRRIIEYNLRVPNEHFTRRPYPVDPDAGSRAPGA